ncbi:MCP four helix bundle domain-containing protein [Agriterribacter sp.]|uniref:MCP four helix bundle domain-containing protein n=1 Tax=Agriterribacter sp. TaxID=2821509 RepID=UPI002D050D9E|nr:MCP four helix bundle domain-containing protein [Agriterribacter sp.]HTN05797.1 MCP four helix bundle domain-containing protein [Agriterribacter sp.]
MKWQGILKEKRKVVMVLLTILVLALINNFVSRQQYGDLTNNISSIYKDRLIPAGYIFSMSDLLYQKKILLQTMPEDNLLAQLDQHNREMSRIIEAYEATYLTKDEQRQWKSFRQHLQQYNEAEALAVSSAAYADKEHLHSSFGQALQLLKQLNETQTNEGMRLQNDSKAIIDSTVMQAYLEVSLLFILGIIGLMLLTSSEKTVYPVSHRYLYN